MTVQTETSRSGPYAGAGTAGPFTVGFRFLSSAHLRVIRTSSAGIDTTLVLDTDYTVSGVGAASGTITLSAVLAVGEKLTIIRDVPFTQTADYVAGDSFPAESHEDALDLLTMQTQQLKDDIGRSLTLPATSVGASTELPSAAPASLIGWDATGQALQNYDASSLGVAIASSSWRTDVFNGTGAQTAFVLSEDPFTASNCDVSVGGVTQIAGVNFSYTVATRTITFLTGAPVAGTGNVAVRYGQAAPLGVPSDLSVTTGKIADGAVTTGKIADDSVTFSKLQNIATATILGRSTAGTGDVEALTGAQVATLLTGSVGQLAGFRNLLINGNFQVNQRGYVSGTAVGAANTYTLDRWRVVVSGQSLVLANLGNGNQITAPAGGVEQVIEGANIGGGTYVLNWSGTATATVNSTARAKGESFTLTAGTNATIRLTGGTASLVQLEPGAAPQPFEHRPIGVELALCQRYYEAGTFNLGGYTIAGVNNTAQQQFSVTKRAAPTLALVSPASSNLSAATADTPTTTGFRIFTTGTGTGGYSYSAGWTAAIEL